MPVSLCLPVNAFLISVNNGDVNGDGLQDLVAISIGGQAWTILGSAPGQFSSPIPFTLTPSPHASTLADANGDGLLDLALVYANSPTVSIFWGSGNGAFATYSTYVSSQNCGARPSIALRDADGDLDPDILVSENSQTKLKFFGASNGQFSPATPAIVVGNHDVNGDGLADLLETGPTGLTARIALNFTTFGSPVTTPLIENHGMGVGDINNDGFADIVTGEAVTGPQTFRKLTTYFGNGTGGFTYSQDLYYNMIADTGRVFIGDLNGDNMSEIVLMGESWGYEVFVNRGNGLFSTGGNQLGNPVPGGWRNTVIITDMDGDGLNDLVTTDHNATNPARLAVRYSKPYSFLGYDGAYAHIADANGDNVNEIVTLSKQGITIFARNSQNFYLPGPLLVCGNLPMYFERADFNNDGTDDYCVSNISDQEISLLLSNNSGGFSPYTSFPVNAYPSHLACADLNNDGNQDIVTGSNQVISFLGDGLGNFSPAATVPSTVASGIPMSLADINSDGFTDMVVHGAPARKLLGLGNGSFSLPTGLGFTATAIALGNINSDNLVDIVSLNSNTLTVRLQNPNGTFSASSSYSVSTQLAEVRIIDLNLDGFQDVVVGGTVLSYFVGNGTGSLLPVASTLAPVQSYGTVMGDLNGDNLPDLLTDYGNILLNLTSTVTSATSGSICAGGALVLTGPPAATSYTWMPGGSNTPSISVSASGNYTLTLSNGNCSSVSNPIAVNVTIMPNPTITVLSATVCAGSGTNLVANGAFQYSWSNGATSASVYMLPAGTTVYTVTGIAVNSCTSTATATLAVNSGCSMVWPGDANNDGVADNLDVLELGLHYNQTGSPRSQPGNTWAAAYASNWSGLLSTGGNVVHADCDGDGLVDGNDMNAVSANYGNTHTFKPSLSNNNDPRIWLVPETYFPRGGSWCEVSVVLGDTINPFLDVAGVAYTLKLDTALIETDSMELRHPISFVNTQGTNLEFSLFKPLGRLFAATARTDNGSSNGRGKIAVLRFKLKDVLVDTARLFVDIGDCFVGGASGTITSISYSGCTVFVLKAQEPQQPEEPENPEDPQEPEQPQETEKLPDAIAVYPNPFDQQVSIEGLFPHDNVEIRNTVGQNVRVKVHIESTYKRNYDFGAGLSSGMYIVKVTRDGGNVLKFKLLKR